MRIFWIIPAVVTVAQLAAAQTAGDFKLLTAEQRRLNLESFEKVWKTVKDKHWDPTLGGVNWNAARAAGLPKVQAAKTMAEARMAISQMLAKLGQSHFAIIPSDLYKEIQPASKSKPKTDSSSPPNDREKAGTEASKREEECGVGIEAVVVDGRAIVMAVEPAAPAQRAGVKPGWVLESVDGIAIADTVSVLAGTNIRERELYEHALIEESFRGPLDEKVDVEFIDGQEQRHKLALERVEPKGTLAHFGYLPETRVWMETRKLDGTIGYVRFNLFLDPEHLMPTFEKAVRDCLSCAGFVIDLRGNAGGIGAMSMGMAGWFIGQRGRRLGTLKARTHTFDFDVNPRPDTFDGPLAVLVDGGSASTAEIFAAGLQDLGRARVFGTQTAGAALPSTIIRLPNSDGLQYADATYTSRNGKVLEGAGVTPDVVVKHTRQSLLAGRDTGLDAAVEWIKSKR